NMVDRLRPGSNNKNNRHRVPEAYRDKAPRKRKPNDIVHIDRQRKKRRRAGSMRLVIFTFLFLACLLGGYFFSNSPFFYTNDIQVRGNEKIDAQSLIDLSGLEKGVNIFAAQTKRAEQWLEINPFILDAQVKRRLPGTLIITIEERKPAAIVVSDKAFLTVATDMVILSRLSKADQLPYPLITGVKDIMPGISPGSVLAGNQIESGIDIIKQMSGDVYPDIAEINVEDPQKIKIFLNSGVEVRIGDSAKFKEKYTLFTSILSEQKQAGKLSSIQYIDVSIIEKPVIFYYF
ncbi:MAG: cell division protein FtsQ/DivIB, partial [Bacillota bacterium]